MKQKFSAIYPTSMLIGLSHALLLFGLGPTIFAEESTTGAQLQIIVGKESPPLERFATDELARMLVGLFPCEVSVNESPSGATSATILVGRPTSNPTVAAAMSDDWPELTDQGIVLKRLDSEAPTLVVGGGSPVAVMWAAYELGERFGVRYLIDRDVYPPRRAWGNLPELNIVMEPNLTIRCWRLVNDLPPGPVSWSLDENQRYLRQLAKMKFNRIHTFLWPTQPFVDYTFRGMPKPSPFLFFGFHFPIDNDMVGYEKLGEYHEHG